MKKILFIGGILLLVYFLITVITGRYNPLKPSKNYPPHGVKFEKKYEKIRMSSYPWTWDTQTALLNTIPKEYDKYYDEVYVTDLNVNLHDEDIFKGNGYIDIVDDLENGDDRWVRFYEKKRNDNDNNVSFVLGPD